MRVESYNLHINIGVCAAAAAFLLLYDVRQDLAYRLTAEDGAVEWTTAACYFTAAVVFAAATRHTGSRNIWFLGLALLCLFAAGEEISWGQRLFGVATPEAFASRNVQQEMNLHNIDGVHQHVRLVGAAIAATLFFAVPTTNAVYGSLRRAYGRQRFPVYPVQLMLVPFAALMFMVIPRAVYRGAISPLDEIGELLISVSFLIYALSAGHRAPAATGGMPAPRASSGSSPSADEPSRPIAGRPATSAQREAMPMGDTHAARLPRVSIGGVAAHAVTQETAVRHVVSKSARGSGGLLVTPNIDHIRILYDSDQFRHVYSQADLVLADGMPLIWASRIQGTPLPERVAGSELIEPMARAAARHKLPIAIVGGRTGSAERVGRLLSERYPDLQVTHTTCPVIPTDEIPHHVQHIAAAMCDDAPAITFVGLGAPKQEIFCAAMRSYLPRTWFIGVGAGLDMMAGHVRKAPRWMTQLGMEWAFRLWQEPSRLAKRYLVHDVPVAIRVLVSSVGLRARGSLRRSGAATATAPVVTTTATSGTAAVSTPDTTAAATARGRAVETRA